MHVSQPGCPHDLGEFFGRREPAHRVWEISICIRVASKQLTKQGNDFTCVNGMKKADNSPLGVPNLQAYHATTWLDHPAHLAERGGNIRHVSHSKARGDG